MFIGVRVCLYVSIGKLISTIQILDKLWMSQSILVIEDEYKLFPLRYHMCIHETDACQGLLSHLILYHLGSSTIQLSGLFCYFVYLIC